MRVLQINIVYKEKSTGRTCYEVEKALLANGDEVCTAYGKGSYISDHAYRIDTPIEYYVHNALSRITGLQGYFSYFATKRLIQFIKKFNPDVIHLRNLHANYLNLPLLFEFLAKADIPVIQNLHDCWAFTGKCPYYTTHRCDKWKTECNHCKYLKQYPQSLFFDFTRKMYRDKKKWYGQIKDLTVIGVSNWVTEEGKKSFLKENARFKTIYNWINTDVFKPYDKKEQRNRYQIDQDRFVVLGVSSNWTAGTPRFEDFMKLADLVDENVQIIMVGQAMAPIDHPRIRHIPFVSDVNELAKLYSLADVYVHMSVEDTFGKVIAEAQACDTPVIVYNVTACPEVVGENCGFTVEPRAVEQIAKIITNMQIGNVKCFGMREWVMKNFLYKDNVNQLLEIYKKVVSSN